MENYELLAQGGIMLVYAFTPCDRKNTTSLIVEARCIWSIRLNMEAYMR